MRVFVVGLVLVACGDDGGSPRDAASDVASCAPASQCITWFDAL